MNKVIDFLTRLVASKFFGEVTLKFENGKVVQVEKRERIRFENLPVNN